jgi:DNA-binding response OmpR family regulator
VRLLVAEDEPDVAQFLFQGLGEAGYAVDLANDGVIALEYLDRIDYDLIVLDLMLPKVDGLSVLSQIRDRGSQTPVLILTARDAIESRIQGLDTGADDYLVKPFSFSELLARLRALLRRPPIQIKTTLQVGHLVMDTLRRQVHYLGRCIELSPREFALLEYLMRHTDQVLTRTQIAEHIWNFDFPGDFKVVDVYIGYLRRKLEPGATRRLIHTVRGVGYRLSLEMEHD